MHQIGLLPQFQHVGTEEENDDELTARASMAMTSERLNEEIGRRIDNVKALFIRMVGRIVTERCEWHSGHCNG